MSGLVNYLSSWWVSPEMNQEETSVIPNTLSINEKKRLPPIPEHTILLISTQDLIGVKLKPVRNVIPAPARNMPPIDKFQLGMLNQAQLKEILSIKLRPVKPRDIKKYYEPRHPVLKELLETVVRK